MNATSLLVTIAPSERDQVTGNTALENDVNRHQDKGFEHTWHISRAALAIVVALVGLIAIWCLIAPRSFAAQHVTSKVVPLNTIAQQTLVKYLENPGQFNADTWSDQYTVAKPYQQAKGVFVTFSKAGKTRACWGTLHPQQPNLVKETVFSAMSAVSKEYRFPPIRLSEVPQLHTQVTIIDKLQAVPSVASINPLRDGLLVRSQGKSGVILAGEATDATYQLTLAKLKAGIQPREAFTLYRMKTHAIH